MGTTTKMAIPYPEATGLVKDGWEDMKDIATQVDAKSGLVLINHTAFSAVSSQSINDVFSTNYQNYLILSDITNSTSSQNYLRLRVSGADASGTDYDYNFNELANNNKSTNLNQTSFLLNYYTSTLTRYTINVFNPFTTTRTTIIGNMYFENSMGVFAGDHDEAISYTGFTIFPSPGTITGSVSVYGYNK